MSYQSAIPRIQVGRLTLDQCHACKLKSLDGPEIFDSIDIYVKPLAPSLSRSGPFSGTRGLLHLISRVVQHWTCLLSFSFYLKTVGWTVVHGQDAVIETRD
jgi:hypothetical protein